MVVFFNIRHQITVAVAGDHQHPLPWILGLVRMGQDIEQAAGFDGDDDALEGRPALDLERLVLLEAPA